jgi:proteasome activator subunit 4
MSKQTLKSRTMTLTSKCRAFYVDKPYSGFLTWATQTKAYIPVPSGDPPISWESKSKEALDAIGGVIAEPDYFEKLMALWGQESSRNMTSPELRPDNVVFIKSIGNNLGL